MGSPKSISINLLQEEIKNELNKYAERLVEGVNKIAEDTAKELKINTKNVKDPEYRLTHLLANGHKKRNGGTVKGNTYLHKNTEEAKKKFISGVKELVRNGC